MVALLPSTLWTVCLTLLMTLHPVPRMPTAISAAMRSPIRLLRFDMSAS